MEVKPILSLKAQEDLKLVQRALAGDSKCYEKLMNKYKKSVYYLVLKMLHNINDAEDVTQESFAKAFSSLEKFDQKYVFSTWLFKIATNSTIDYIRKKKIETLSINGNNYQGDDESTSEIQIKDNSSPHPDNKLEEQERSNYLNLALKELPDKYRLLIELRYFRDFSYEEISLETDLPLGTVKAQLFRAKELLQELLKKMENDL